MSKRSIVALTMALLVAIGLFFAGHRLWNLLLVMHGHSARY